MRCTHERRACSRPRPCGCNGDHVCGHADRSAPRRAPETLVRWGANYGPSTTNGQWWRLVTAMFVHGGMVSLPINLAALVQLGVILERLIGPAGIRRCECHGRCVCERDKPRCGSARG